MRLAGTTLMLLLLGVAGATPGSLAAQAVIRGTVTDPGQAPVAGADIILLQGSFSWRGVTDASGRFTFSVEPGIYDLVIRASGFLLYRQRVPAAGRSDTPLTIRLSTEAQRLDSLTVVERPTFGGLRDFERRQRMGMGYYVTAEDLDRAAPISISQYLRRFSVLSVMDSAGTPVAVSTRGPKVVTRDDGGLRDASCVMRVAMNGRLLPAGTTLDLLTPQEVGGIEIYAGAATIPAEFAGLAQDLGCGLIVIWGRR